MKKPQFLSAPTESWLTLVRNRHNGSKLRRLEGWAKRFDLQAISANSVPFRRPNRVPACQNRPVPVGSGRFKNRDPPQINLAHAAPKQVQTRQHQHRQGRYPKPLLRHPVMKFQADPHANTRRQQHRQRQRDGLRPHHAGLDMRQ